MGSAKIIRQKIREEMARKAAKEAERQAGPTRKTAGCTPEEHRKLVAGLSLQPEPRPTAPTALGRRAFARVLREMGFESYDDYLRSSGWYEIRRRVMKRARKMCEDCGGKATQVHHEVYTIENLKGRDLRFLHALCDGCHHHRHGLPLA